MPADPATEAQGPRMPVLPEEWGGSSQRENPLGTSSGTHLPPGLSQGVSSSSRSRSHSPEEGTDGKNRICFWVTRLGLTSPGCEYWAGDGMLGPGSTACCWHQSVGQGSVSHPGSLCPRSAGRQWLPGGTCSSEQCPLSAIVPLPAEWGEEASGGEHS